MTQPYLATEPTAAEITALPGPALLEFGTPWCGYCQRAQPLIESALADVAGIRHLKVEDGPGRPLGRAFRIKLWPTLVFLRDGQEVARSVRPTNLASIQDGLRRILDAPAQP